MRSPWRLAAVASAGILLVPLAVGLPTSAAAPPATFAAPVANPPVPLRGENVAVTGAVPGATKRAAALQRWAEDRWVTVARRTTTAGGKYTFTVRPTGYVALRVLAPATDDLPRRWSRALRLNPVPTTATLSVTGSRLTSQATAKVTPVRVGRTLRLQAWTAGTSSWQTVQMKEQSTATATWTLSDLPEGTSRYRVLAAPWNGAPQAAGPAVDFTPPPLVTSLPRLTLSTENAAPVDSKEIYVPGTLQVDTGDLLPMQIKGRGNSTWNAAKKPYRIKLTTKASLLGLPTERDWVLLANYADRSKLRNWTAFELARRTSMAWTPQSRFVQVTLNGTELGLYQLVEQVEASAAKVPLAAGGLLLEVDQRGPANGDPGFVTTRGTPISYKDPGEPTAEQVTAVSGLVEEFESALYSESYLDPTSGYARYVDLTSFADWYLISEVMLNLDGDFLSSVFLTWDPAGTLRMGPVWDFDLSSGFTSTIPGCCEETTGWWLRPDPDLFFRSQHNTHWLTRMTTDPAFLALLEQRWATTVKPAIAEVRAGFADQLTAIEDDAIADWVLWKYSTTSPHGTVHAADPAGEIDYLDTWLGARTAWIDAQLS